MNYKQIKSELEKLSQLSIKEIKEMQLRKLKERLNYHSQNNEWYKKYLEEHNLDISRIKSLEDLSLIPILEKEHIINNFPFSSVPEDKILRFYQTSGTTGNPKLIPYNRHDIDRSAQLKARGLIFGGVKKGDKGIIIMAYGPWASGLMSQQAGEYIGLTIAGDAKLAEDGEWHPWALKKYSPDYLISQPSFLVRLEEMCNKKGIEISESSMSHLFVCGDMSSKSFKKEFGKRYNSKIIDLYCCSEFGCISAECKSGNLHYWADELIIEIINPKTKERLPCGEIGEVVVSGFYKVTPPLIRYNTHDLSLLLDSKCECGKDIPAISQILGRGDSMVSIAGANVYPIQIEDAINKIPELTNIYRFNIVKENYKDKIILEVEVKKNHYKDSQNLKRMVYNNIISIAPELNYVINQSLTASQPEIILLKEGNIPERKGKIKRIFDKRNGNV